MLIITMEKEMQKDNKTVVTVITPNYKVTTPLFTPDSVALIVQVLYLLTDSKVDVGRLLEDY